MTLQTRCRVKLSLNRLAAMLGARAGRAPTHRLVGCAWSGARPPPPPSPLASALSRSVSLTLASNRTSRNLRHGAPCLSATDRRRAEPRAHQPARASLDAQRAPRNLVETAGRRPVPGRVPCGGKAAKRKAPNERGVADFPPPVPRSHGGRQDSAQRCPRVRKPPRPGIITSLHQAQRHITDATLLEWRMRYKAESPPDC